MGERRNYNFAPLNESGNSDTIQIQGPQPQSQNNSQLSEEYTSRADCCGVSLWKLTVGGGSCQCSTSTCSIQFGGCQNTAPAFTFFNKRRILFAMVNCLILAAFVYFMVTYFVEGDTNKCK